MDSTRFEQIIVVTEAAPLIETDTADLSTRITSEELDTMPSAARDFRDVTKFIPGVTGVRINTVDGSTGDGLPSIRGEGQYGNNYLVDGLSVRDPATKSTGSPLNFDAIQEIQIITDGFSPEYGRALGGVVNVITKSGSNEFHGELALQYESDALSGDEKDSLWAQNRDFTKFFPYFNIGGPILKDKLWFFLSYNYEDASYDYGIEDLEITDSNLFTKLTFAITPKYSLSVSSTIRDFEESNRGLDQGREPGALGKLTWDDVRLRVNFKGILSDSSVLEAKYGFIYRESEDQPMSGDAGAPMYTNLDTGSMYNNYDNFDKAIRERNDFSLEYTHFLDQMMGTHEIKAGFLYEKTASERDLTFTGSDTDLFPDSMEGGSEYQYKEGVPYVYYDYSGAAVENETDGYGFYLQDKWAPIENLNVMLGFRIDAQDVKNDRGETLFDFGLDETFAPRMTLAYDITKDGRNIVKFGVGRFYDVVSTSLAEWGNTASPYSFDRYSYGGPGNPYTGGNFSPGDERDPNNWGTWEHFDDDDDGVDDRHEFHPGDPTYTQDPAGHPLIYDENLKPYHKDEILIEYDRGIGNNYAAKIRYIQGWTRDLIEDVAYNIDDWYIVNFDKKKRDYKAVEVEFNGRPMQGLRFNFAYVWSESKGTTPGQFERGGFSSSWGSGNNVGVFGDRPPWDPDGEDYDEDAEFWAELLGGLGGLDGDDGWYGRLPYSAEHQVLLNLNYTAPFGLVIGSAMQWNSGYAWQKRGWQDAYGGYLTFPEGRGVRDMPSLFWWDLSAAYKYYITDDMAISARLDIFNVIDGDKPVSLKQDWNAEGSNENFGEVLKRQDPRSMRLSVSFTF